MLDAFLVFLCSFTSCHPPSIDFNIFECWIYLPFKHKASRISDLYKLDCKYVLYNIIQSYKLSAISIWMPVSINKQTLLYTQRDWVLHWFTIYVLQFTFYSHFYWILLVLLFYNLNKVGIVVEYFGSNLTL